MTSTGTQPDTTSRIPPVWRLAAIGLFLSVLSYSALLLNNRSGGITIVWPSNGLLLGALLLAPRRQWLAYIAVAFSVDLGVNLSISNPSRTSVYLAGCNMIEVLVAAFLLYRTIAPSPDLTRRRQLVSFLACGVILAPAIAAFLASLTLQRFHSNAMAHTFRLWFTADALGISTVTPLCLAFGQRGCLPKQSAFGFLWPFALLCGVTSMFSCKTDSPFFFQFFIAISMLSLYLLEVVMAESGRLQQSLQSSEGYFRLLAETSRDVIVLTDLDGERRYVSPAAAELPGGAPGELLGGSYRELVHPDDLEEWKGLLEDCMRGKTGKILQYRCRRKDGSYLWMESTLRLYHSPATGEPFGFVNVVRDISRRKAAEEDLEKAFRLVESLASLDGLTEIANRRRLDQVLEHEWRVAIRTRCEISLLLIDVDHFKSFNDIHGHLRGDDCLRQIAQVILGLVSRPADLVARYGGEEFALVLTNTPESGARQIAERIRSAVQLLDIPHEGNPHGVVTVSIGCATRTPKVDSKLEGLIAAADNALYKAKNAGRNAIEVAGDAVLQPFELRRS